MAKSEEDFLKELQLDIKDQAGQRFDLLAKTSSLQTVAVAQEKAKLETYGEIEEVSVTPEVLEVLDHGSQEIEKIQVEEINSLRDEYTALAQNAKSAAETLKKQEERTTGAFSIDKQIRDARQNVISSKKAWRDAQAKARLQGNEKSNILGRMLGRFTGIDMGQEAYKQAKESVKNAHRSYRSAKLSLKKALAGREEKRESVAEARAKATYYKERMTAIEQRIQVAKGKISHVNDKLRIHTQSLDKQYQVVQTYLKLKALKERLSTDKNFSNQMKLIDSDMVAKLEQFSLPKGSLVISLKNPLTPEMIESLDGYKKAMDDYDNKKHNFEQLIETSKKRKEEASKENEALEAKIKDKESSREKKKEESKKLQAKMDEIKAQSNLLEIQTGETSESISSKISEKTEQLSKMEEAGKKPGDPEYDKLKKEIELLGVKQEYVHDQERIDEIVNQIQGLDPLTNTDQINALEAQRRAIIEKMARSPYTLEKNVLKTKYAEIEAENTKVCSNIQSITRSIEEDKKKQAQNTELIKQSDEQIAKANKAIVEIEEAKKSLTESSKMIALNTRVTELERTATEPTIIDTLRLIKEEVQKKLQARIAEKAGTDKETPLPAPDRDED